MSPDGVEEFLDEVAIYDLEAKTDDRTDFMLLLQYRGPVGRFLRSFPFGNYVPVVGWRAYRQFEVRADRC